MWVFDIAVFIQNINMQRNSEPETQLCWSGYCIITFEAAQNSAMDNNTKCDSHVIFSTVQ